MIGFSSNRHVNSYCEHIADESCKKINIEYEFNVKVVFKGYKERKKETDSWVVVGEAGGAGIFKGTLGEAGGGSPTRWEIKRDIELE